MLPTAPDGSVGNKSARCEKFVGKSTGVRAPVDESLLTRRCFGARSLVRGSLAAAASSAGAAASSTSTSSAASSTSSSARACSASASAAAASSSARSAASIAASSSSGGSSPPSGTTSVSHLDVTSLEELDRHRVAADPLDRRRGRSCAGRRGPCASRQISSAMSVGVTEPKSAPGRAGLHVEAQLRLVERVGDLLRLLEALRLVPGALLVALAQLGDLRRRRLLGEPPRQQEVARVAAARR